MTPVEARAIIAERDGLRRALEEIADPLAAMGRRAKAEDAILNGMAYSLANDPHHLKSIARAALEKFGGKP